MHSFSLSLSKVLVVDDEARWLRIVSLYLENRGYEVTTALNGEEALRKIDESRPDVVIADIGMPGMDGYELYIRVSSQVVLHLIAVHAEKRFWPMWEKCLPIAHGVLLLLVPTTKEALTHCHAFLRALQTLTPSLPIHALTRIEPDDLVYKASGWDASHISAGSADDQTVRLTAVDSILQRWLAAH